MTDGQAGTHPPAPTGGQGELDEWRFDCGVAISVYQNSGGSNTQWETFERQKRWFGRPAIKVLLAILPYTPILPYSHTTGQTRTVPGSQSCSGPW